MEVEVCDDPAAVFVGADDVSSFCRPVRDARFPAAVVPAEAQAAERSDVGILVARQRAAVCHGHAVIPQKQGVPHPAVHAGDAGVRPGARPVRHIW